MTRRRVRVALVLLALLAVVGFATFMQSRGPRPGDGITPEAVAAIREGMTYAEVEALMGCPHGTYSSHMNYLDTTDATIMLGKDGKIIGHPRQVYWKGRRAVVSVKFFKGEGEGVVIEVRALHKVEQDIDTAHSLRMAWSRVWHW